MVDACMLHGELGEDYTYALTDLNNDAVAELCVRKLDTLYVFTITEIGLQYIKGLPYTTVLEDGGLLYQRDGGAPTHTEYQYSRMGTDNQVTDIISFSWYDGGSVVAEGAPDRYYVDGAEVTRAVYEETANRYLSKQSIDWLNKDTSPRE